MQKKTKIAAAGALLVAGTLAAAPTPVTAAPAPGVAAPSIHEIYAGVHQDRHITNVAAKKKAGKKKPAPKSKK